MACNTSTHQCELDDCCDPPCGQDEFCNSSCQCEAGCIGHREQCDPVVNDCCAGYWCPQSMPFCTIH
jgi:hypothetical protein